MWKKTQVLTEGDGVMASWLKCAGKVKTGGYCTWGASIGGGIMGWKKGEKFNFVYKLLQYISMSYL